MKLAEHTRALTEENDQLKASAAEELSTLKSAAQEKAAALEHEGARAGALERKRALARGVAALLPLDPAGGGSAGGKRPCAHSER